jgi:hypothetical protein
MLSSDGKKQGTALLGMEMLHVIARNPGDEFVTAASTHKHLAVHATRRRDGFIGVMLVNEDPDNSVTVPVQISGGAIGAKGRRIEYGSQQAKAGAGLSVSEMDGLGTKFTVTVPAYTITDLLLTPSN